MLINVVIKTGSLETKTIIFQDRCLKTKILTLQERVHEGKIFDKYLAAFSKFKENHLFVLPVENVFEIGFLERTLCHFQLQIQVKDFFEIKNFRFFR